MQRRQFAMYGSLCTLAWMHPSHHAYATHVHANKDVFPFMDDDLAGPKSGPWRRLFLDSAVIELQSGLRRVFHKAEKHSDGPILIADQAWEGTSAIIGPYVYGTILYEEGRFRMWYQLLFQGNHIGYAESEDGIRWQKPKYPFVQYENQATNLVVSEFAVAMIGGRCHNPSVIRIANPRESQKRYALYGFDNQAGFPRVAYSPDGLQWKYHDADTPKKLFDSSDVVNFGFDVYTDRYFCTWKTRNRRGRAVGIAWSKDGEQWSKPVQSAVFVADDLDPSDTQIYGMPAFPYQGMYIGIPWIYRARYFRYGEYTVDKLHDAQRDSSRRMETQIAWSWDLIHWTRPYPRESFIPNGSADAWDRGMIVTARAPVAVGDRLYFYYGGTDQVHDDKKAKAAIGLATLRMDGFCSMQTETNDPGWFISRREPILGPRLMINAKTESGGSIRVEILDRANRVVPGFSKSDCIPFVGDAVAYEMQWRKREDGHQWKGRDYKFRFVLDRAELFSYLPLDLDATQPDLARFPTAGP